MKTFVSTADGRRTPLESVEETAVAIGHLPKPTSTPAVKKNKGGRPKGSGLKLTPELQARFCAAVAGGMFLSRAAKLCGISLDTFEAWCAKGEKSVEPYGAFVAAFEKADVECEAFLVKILKDAAPKDFRAALAMLQRRYPSNWSDHASRLAVLGPEGNGYDGRSHGLSISIHLEDCDCRNCHDPKPIDRTAESARTAQELEDRRARTRDIEAIEVLSSAAIKDEV